MRRADLVDEDEGADHRAGLVGQGSPHVEGADIVGRRGDNLHRHSPGASVLIVSAWTRWPGRSPSALFTARWRATRFCPAKPAHAIVRLTCDSPLLSPLIAASTKSPPKFGTVPAPDITHTL